MRLTEAELWELRCLDERIKNAQIVLGLCEGEAARARERVLLAHGLDPSKPHVFEVDGTIRGRADAVD